MQAVEQYPLTKLLEEAFSQADRLPEQDQNTIAEMILSELESDRKWDELFAKHPERLSTLADSAWARHETGRSEPLDPDQL